MLQQAGAEFLTFTFCLLELLVGGSRGRCGGGAIAVGFGLGSVLLLESRSLGLPFLALGLVPRAQGVRGVSLGADGLRLGIGFATRGCAGLEIFRLQKQRIGVCFWWRRGWLYGIS